MTWGSIGAAAIGAGASYFGSSGGGSSKQGLAYNDLSIENQGMRNRLLREGTATVRPQAAFGTQSLYSLGNLFGFDPSSIEAMDAGNKYGQYGNFENPYIGGTPAGQDPSMTGFLMQRFGNDQFEQDPGYQFRMEEAQKGLERSQSARGGLLSGGAAKEMSRYTQGLASDEYMNAYNRFTSDQNNIYNRLMGGVGVGQQAAAMQLGQGGQPGMMQVAGSPSGLSQAGSALTDIAGGFNQQIQYNKQNEAMNRMLSGFGG